MKKKEVLELDVITHYEEDDKEFSFDYLSMEVFSGKEKIAGWADEYHDHSFDKLEGLVRGIAWATGKEVKQNHKDVADGEY